MDAIELQRWHDDAVQAWAGRWGVPALRVFQRVGSTNDVAREMADAGAAEGTLVLADAQTRGRGRRGRDWQAPPGASLSMSMVLRPATPAATRILTLRLGLAAARGLDTLLDTSVGLKWPNDLVLDGGKVGGILCEAAATSDRVTYVVAGIGLNLRPPDDGWPADLAGRATSLAAAAAARLSAPAIAERVADEWLAVAAAPAATLSQEERREFDARDVLRGSDILVDDRAAGIADGVTPAGALRVRHQGGTSDVIAGTVRARNPLPGERA